MNKKCFYVIILVLTIVSSNILADDIVYFIYSGPTESTTPLGSHSAIIYRYDNTSDSLLKEWQTPDNEWIKDVRCYPNNQMLLVSTKTGLSDKIKNMYYVKADSVITKKVISYENRENIGFYHILKSNDTDKLIKTYSHSSNGLNSVVFDLNTEKEVQSKSLSDNEEFDLAGLSSAYYGSSHDILSYRSIKNGIFQPFRESYYLDVLPVPDSLIKMQDSNGWNLIADEDNFIIMCSVPNKNGLKFRELLIYNKLSTVWSSVLIEGDMTTPRVFNGFIVGEVKISSPDTDWKKRLIFSPIITDSIVIIDPLKLKKNLVRLGKRCKFLWIDDDNKVYYRIGQELYKAKFESGDFINRELILKDFMVNCIHWAFQGQ